MIESENQSLYFEMCFQTDILPYLQNNELCVQHFNNLGLLGRSLNCPTCKNRLFWTKYKKVNHGFDWKCQNGSCAKYKSIFSIHTGSFFAQSNIQLQKWLPLIYLWSIQTSNKQTELQTGLAGNAINSAFACLRELCDRNLQKTLSGWGDRV